MSAVAIALPGSPGRRVGLTLVLSLALYAVVLGGWRVHRTPPVAGMKPIEVALVDEVVSRPVKRAQPPPRPVSTRPAPAPEKVPEPPANDAVAAEPPAEPITTAKAEPRLIDPNTDISILNNPKPPYPLAARRARIQGLVLLSVFVRADGSLADVKVKKSSGSAILDRAAADTVRDRWNLPARYRNDIWDVPIDFRLQQ